MDREADQIDNLTGLRAFAAMSVVLLHMRPLMSSDSNPLDFLFQNYGFGVQVFFVLSGFILAYRHADRFRDRLTAREYCFFIWLRFARIYPVHLFMLLIVAALYPLGEHDTVLAFLLNLTMTQSWGIITDITFNAPAWTISAEWFAYLLFPLLCFATGRRQPLLWIALASGAVWCIPHIAGYGMLYGAASVNCLLHVAVGVFSYRLCLLIPDWRWLWRPLAIVMGPMLMFMIWHPMGLEAFTVATAVLIVALFKAGPVFGYANPVSVRMGQASYSLYLVHKPILLAFGGTTSAWPPLIIIAVMIAAAMIVYRWIEEPGRKLLQAINPARQAYATG